MAKGCLPLLPGHLCYCTVGECFLKTGQSLVSFPVSEEDTWDSRAAAQPQVQDTAPAEAPSAPAKLQLLAQL